jgi:hypothetical protein
MNGRAVRKDSGRQPFDSPPAANGTGAVHTGTPRSLTSDVSSRGKLRKQHAFKKRQRLQPERVHQPMPCLVRGKGDVSGSGSYCRFKICPGLKMKKKITRPCKTVYQCEQCTVEKGYDFWFCHTTKKVNGKQTVVSCHLRYHSEMCFSTTGSATESSFASDLTEE